MSKVQMTYGRLREVLNDFMLQINTSPAFEILHHSKFIQFKRINAIRIDRLEKNQKNIIEKFVEKDDAGEYKTEDREGVLVYVFKDKETEQEYLAELNAFMGRSIDVFI